MLWRLLHFFPSQTDDLHTHREGRNANQMSSNGFQNYTQWRNYFSIPNPLHPLMERSGWVTDGRRIFVNLPPNARYKDDMLLQKEFLDYHAL